MSQGNVAYEMQNGIPFPLPSATVVKVINVADATYGSVCLFAYGNTVPTDGSSGYGIGCLFLHTDGDDGSALYVNEDTTASCDFNLITVAAA